jgi:UDP-N-acetylmuramyl pentapeptide phosphotransferase/UDP-N-acetylglucosamine-1-phosphate transferase
VLLIERNPGVSAFTPLLICIHPVTEVLLSIYRRHLAKVSPGTADRLHLHTLVMRRVVTPWLRSMHADDDGVVRFMRNPVTGLVIALMSVPAVTVGLLLQGSPFWGAVACLLFATAYVTLYARLVRFHWCSPLAFLFIKPVGTLRA